MFTIQKLIQNQRKFFDGGRTRNPVFRRRQLLKLLHGIKKYEVEILLALQKDLNKSPFEAYETELGIIYEEIRYMLRHLKKLSEPRQVHTPLLHFPSCSRIYQEPYGIVLIMSPWNYPFQLTLAPVLGAMAAGNCMVVKPSNYAVHTSMVLRKMFRELYDPAYLCVLEGGREVNQDLLNQKFDYIFFTGGTEGGRRVMSAAARYITPVTLELGGKSPCIVDETADPVLAGRRIAWGKFLNAGQTCVAPDYVLVHHRQKEKLIEQIWTSVQKFYGQTPLQHPDYAKIINEKHFKRLLSLLEGEQVVLGGKSSVETMQIEPTILHQAGWQSAAMQEEIFGPILPVIGYDSLDEAILQIRRRPRPLALYLFTRSGAVERRILQEISFGGGCINDTVVHLATPHMPFGGVGESGMGSCHGKAGFQTFSHSKSILKKSSLLDLPVRYPPFSKNLKLLKFFFNLP